MHTPRTPLPRALRARVRTALPSVTSVETAQPWVALTFDDGPDPRLTGDVLDVLRSHGAKATFLLVADRVRTHPDLGRRIVADGHEVGLHGDKHVDLRELPPLRQYVSLRRGRQDVQTLLSTSVRWFRPPYGKQDPETVLAVRAAGMRPLMWSTSGYDWKPLGLQEQLDHVVPALRPGAVVLLHDGAARVAEPPPPPPANQPALLDQLLRAVAAAGLEPVTAGRLCAAGRPVREPWFERWLHH